MGVGGARTRAVARLGVVRLRVYFFVMDDSVGRVFLIGQNGENNLLMLRRAESMAAWSARCSSSPCSWLGSPPT